MFYLAAIMAKPYMLHVNSHVYLSPDCSFIPNVTISAQPEVTDDPSKAFGVKILSVPPFDNFSIKHGHKWLVLTNGSKKLKAEK